jgi:glucuronokinase
MSLERHDRWSAVVLASCNQEPTVNNDIPSSREVVNLSRVPYSLYPVGEIPAIDHLLKSFRLAGIMEVFVVTNECFHAQFVEWAITRGLPASNIVQSKESNKEINLSSLLRERENGLKEKDLLVVAGDVVLSDDFNLSTFLSSIPLDHNGVVYSTKDLVITDIKTSLSSLSDLSPALYAFGNKFIPYLCDYFKSIQNVSTDEKDIEKLLNDNVFCRNLQIVTHKVLNRFNVANPEEYEKALQYHSTILQEKLASLPIIVTEQCSARIGLMGNPSDGFNGKTLSFLIKNFNATVTIKENDLGNDTASSSSSIRRRQVTIIPHPILDPSSFVTIDQLQLHTIYKGYYGGVRLLQATIKSFAERCIIAGILIHLQRGLILSYDTDIPRMVGLSGSSAIVVATFRALLKYYGLSLIDLNIKKEDFPQIILDIERLELDIACGLQDRVIQTYGGLVHMDFTVPNLPIYTEFDRRLLPEFYLAYNMNVGGESGKVHSTVKARWIQQDRKVIQGMQSLGELADRAVECLSKNDKKGLGVLMDQNFSIRRDIYGDDVVGDLNIEMANLASSLGLSSKFTGSGGALLCLNKSGEGWLSVEEEETAVKMFQKHGFKFIRIQSM